MKRKHFIIGSRSSRLALVQSRYVMDRLKDSHPCLAFEIRTIKTVGDKILDVALSKIGDKGLFTKEIEEALLRCEIDFAVHSMKDLPTELPQGLRIAAVTKREEARDVLVSGKGFTLKTLPKGSRVGTSSLRRRAQILHIRQDLAMLDLRGNLDTRIRKLEQGSFDAIILAYAGIKRLKLNPRLSEIPAEEVLPQAGQGALGIEIRVDNRQAHDIVKVLDDADSHLCIDAERALLSGLEGGCQVPIGVYARIKKDKICVKAGVFSLNGRIAVKDEIEGDKKEAQALGRQLAERFLKKKVVRQVLEEVRKGIG